MTDSRCDTESEIMESPLVLQAIMFGRERNQTGVLIELVEGASSRCNNKEGRAKLAEEIWYVLFRLMSVCLD